MPFFRAGCSRHINWRQKRKPLIYYKRRCRWGHFLDYMWISISLRNDMFVFISVMYRVYRHSLHYLEKSSKIGNLMGSGDWLTCGRLDRWIEWLYVVGTERRNLAEVLWGLSHQVLRWRMQHSVHIQSVRCLTLSLQRLGHYTKMNGAWCNSRWLFLCLHWW